MASKLKNVKGILIDLSGTIHVEDQAITGALEAIERLVCSGIKHRFITNTTKESKSDLYSRLKSIGFNIQFDSIVTSLTVASEYVDLNSLNPFYMLQESALKDFKTPTQENHNAVVIGLAPDAFCYNEMNKAFRLIQSGAKLIAIHKSRYFKTNEGLCLGPGGFVSALEYAAGTKAIVLGKPSPEFFHSCLESIKVTPEEAVMIGDDVLDDVIGAQDIGIHGILVKTGKYKPGDENKHPNKKPNYVVENINAAIDMILS